MSIKADGSTLLSEANLEKAEQDWTWRQIYASQDIVAGSNWVGHWDQRFNFPSFQTHAGMHSHRNVYKFPENGFSSRKTKHLVPVTDPILQDWTSMRDCQEKSRE